MAELVFTVGSLLVLPFWLLMAGLPSWSATRRLMASPLVLLPLPLLYAVLLVRYGKHVLGILQAMLLDPSGSFVHYIADILGTPEGAAMAWMHLLALDLFLGRWEYLDSQERGMSPLVMTPVLWATFLAGPIGLLLYLPLRALLGTRPKS